MRLVAALDGSRLSSASLEWLPLLSPLGIESITLVSVSEMFDEGAMVEGSADFFERECLLLTAYLKGEAEKLGNKVGVPVATTVRCGVPDEEIRRSADKARADLVLITTHGRSGLSRWAIGSVADKVLRQSKKPVLVIGPSAVRRKPGPAIRRILVPLDGSLLAERGLSIGSQWAHALGADLHVVRVVSMPAAGAEDVSVLYTPRLLESLKEIAGNYLQAAREKSTAACTISEVRVGATAEELIRYAEQNQIDLVVMTSRGRRGVARAVLGSTADRLLHGPAPVLVLPPA